MQAYLEEHKGGFSNLESANTKKSHFPLQGRIEGHLTVRQGHCTQLSSLTELQVSYSPRHRSPYGKYRLYFS